MPRRKKEPNPLVLEIESFLTLATIFGVLVFFASEPRTPTGMISLGQADPLVRVVLAVGMVAVALGLFLFKFIETAKNEHN